MDEMTINAEGRKRLVSIINETVEFYSEDTSRRAVASSGACKYFIPHNGHAEDRMCALGRLITADKDKVAWEYVAEINGSLESLMYGYDHRHRQEFGEGIYETARDYLLGENSDLPDWFLNDLQTLHDGNSHWDDDGLTDQGREVVDRMIDDISRS